MISVLKNLWNWAKRYFGYAVFAASFAGAHGYWTIELVRAGEVIHTERIPNGITDVGMNYLLGAGFHDHTLAVDAWYLGFINNSGYTAVAAGDTMASHTGWTEFTTYSESTRQAWPNDAAATRSITNTTPAVITVSSSGTLRGVFITTGSAKSGTTGTLWSTALFSSTVPVAISDEIRATYTISG